MLGLDAPLQQAIAELGGADALLVATGAGMGVDSGLPDFRGTKGFWVAYPELAKFGKSFAGIANSQSFADNPGLVWAFYGHRLHLYRRTDPHKGFDTLLELGRSKKDGFFVFTSNVDGQFQKAGFPQDRIVECHGSIHHLQCTQPCCRAIWSADQLEIPIDDDQFVAKDPLPVCPHCGALARPNILMFRDRQWIRDRTAAQRARLNEWVAQVCSKKSRLAIVEIGAGKRVPSVRSQSEKIAQEANGVLIRINPRDSDVSKGHISIPLAALIGIQSITQFGQMP